MTDLILAYLAIRTYQLLQVIGAAALLQWSVQFLGGFYR